MTPEGSESVQVHTERLCELGQVSVVARMNMRAVCATDIFNLQQKQIQVLPDQLQRVSRQTSVVWIL